MNGVLERTLAILELLARHGEGMELAKIADTLAIPRSGVHRLLVDLTRCGYVRQARAQGEYMLTTKMVSLGLSFLSHSGIVDIAQPLLDQLAQHSGELVRLGVIDGERLTWVARAQGARQGLRYDPDMGSDAQISCSASGHAWLAALSDEDALALVARQGLGKRSDFGPQAPETLQQVMAAVQATRVRGFSLTEETYTAGLNAIGAVVQLAGQAPLGVITIAGPTVRFTAERMQALGASLCAAAAQLAAASGSCVYFSQSARSAPGHLPPIYAP